jgi:glucosyl-3-phosphoglycerate synthase
MLDVSEWTPERLLRAKAGRTISVCIPCRNEAATIGELVGKICADLVERVPLVDELIVLDDRSTDGTAEVATAAGAQVVSISEVHERYGEGNGKGNALWATLASSTGEFVVWCDGDVTSFEPSWVVHLLAPLMTGTDLAMVKGCYARPTDHGGGGRTTELVARPLISLFFPELAGLHQPLSGEYAVRRSVIEELPFVEGWGAEMALLIDLSRRCGVGSIAQVDLGTRLHRHQDLHSLSVQAAEVMATVLARAGAGASFAVDHPALLRPNGVIEALNLAERPSLASARAATAH